MEHRITLWVEVDATVEEVKAALFQASRPGWITGTSPLANHLGDVLGFDVSVVDYEDEEYTEDAKWTCRRCGKELVQFREFAFGPEWVTADGSKVCNADGGHVLKAVK
jgi:hypothetical protein